MYKIVLTETRLREMIYESVNNALNENAVDEGRAQALWNGTKAFVGPRQDGQTRWQAAKQAYGQEMYNTGQRLLNKYQKYNKTATPTSDNGKYNRLPRIEAGNANQTKTAGMNQNGGTIQNQNGGTIQNQNTQTSIQSIVQGQEYQNLINLGEQALLDFKRNGQRYNYRTRNQSTFIMQVMQFLKRLRGQQ